MTLHIFFVAGFVGEVLFPFICSGDLSAPFELQLVVQCGLAKDPLILLETLGAMAQQLKNTALSD
jgi:hypothetical protein